MKMMQKIIWTLFLSVPLSILAITPSQGEPFTDISGEAVAAAISSMNQMTRAFFLQRDIGDYMAYQRDAAKEDAGEELKNESREVKNDFQTLMGQLPHLAFLSVFKEKKVYRINPSCAMVVTDIYYDEDMVGEVEHPPILDLMMTMICESKNRPEPAGTLSFVLSVSPEVQKQFDTLKFTIIGGFDTELFQSKEEFKEYVKEGVLTGVKIRVFDSGSRKARWDPPLMNPEKKGIFTIYGELVSPGFVK